MAKITPLPDGPLLALDLTSFSRADGSEQVEPKLALCRCGDSAKKPLCDGTHAKAGFKSEKRDDRTPDGVVDYAGEGTTVHDNRGVCAHAGICTTELPSVWRMGTEPWIDPDGGTPEKIIDVARRCPSGALKATVGGVEHQDTERKPSIHVAKDGPYVVTGGVELEGEAFGQGASREHYTLCRCGASKNKPFCDGTHWSVEFRAD